MAVWTAEIITKGVHPDNPQNMFATVRFTDGVEVHDLTQYGTDITKDHLDAWAAAIIQNFTDRDAALATLVGVTALTPIASPKEDAGILAFRDKWHQLQKLQSLGTDDAEIVAQCATLKDEIAVLLKLNPEWIKEVA